MFKKLSAATGSFKQFFFGRTIDSDGPLSVEDAGALIKRGRELCERAPLPSQEKMLELFARLSKAWQDPNYPRRKEALALLVKTSGLSRELLSAVFVEFPKLFSPETLLKKIEGELGSPAILEEPVTQMSTKARLIARPAGLVLHVAAGNVFLGCIDSMIDGIITKNVNFVKMSTDDTAFPVIFAESIRDFDRANAVSGRLAVLWWKSPDAKMESLFKREMDRIVFWGGYDALASWKEGLGPSAVLIQHGPKVSFGIVSETGLEKTADLADVTERIAFDIAIWEQRACHCPQTLFIDGAISAPRAREFIDSLAESLRAMNRRFPPARRSDDEYVEILRAREAALAKRFATGEDVRVVGPKTLDWTIIYHDRAAGRRFEPSPLNRTIIIKRYNSLDDLSVILEGQSFYLQSVGYCLGDLEVSRVAAVLSRAGATRLSPFGAMAMPVPGTPHDGIYALRDLTRFTVIEDA